MRQLHPGLNLNNIKFFLDAARLESVSLAAESNAVTQSAVSQGIQRLEKAVGVPLTNHQRNAFALTSEGKRVAAYAQQILNLIEEMCESLEADVSVNKRVEFGCPISIAKA